MIETTDHGAVGTCLSLTLFGGFHVRQLEPATDVTIGAKKGRALLAYLALRPTQVHPRDKLATLLWGDKRQECARQSLRQTLCDLRADLPPAAATLLRVGQDNIGLDATRVVVDVVEFQRLAAGKSIESLEQAGALYQGELLEGIPVDEPLFEEWLRLERDRALETALSVFAKLLARQREAGLIEDAILSGLRLLEIDPLQEVVHRTLIRLYLSQGRVSAARRQYEHCAQMLRREFGEKPQAETTALIDALGPGRTFE
jgi:DNA-binding SARP family transcriptional activator